MDGKNIKIEHWIIRYPHGDAADEPGSSDTGAAPLLFRFRSDYRFVSLTYRHSSPIDPIDPTGRKQ